MTITDSFFYIPHSGYFAYSPFLDSWKHDRMNRKTKYPLLAVDKEESCSHFETRK